MKVTKIALITAIAATVLCQSTVFARRVVKRSSSVVKKSQTPIVAKKTSELPKEPATTPEQDNTQEMVKEEFIDIETSKAAALLVTHKAQEQLKNGEIEPADAAKLMMSAAKIIGNKNYELEQIKKAMEPAPAPETEQSYMSQLAAKAYSVGQSIIAPFKSGYGYTDEEKGKARLIIVELQKQLQEIDPLYKQDKEKATDPTEQIAVEDKYKQVKELLENEIHQQKIITGEAMSRHRKLFWGAVAAGGVATSGALAQRYFGTTPTPVAPVAQPSSFAPTSPKGYEGHSKAATADTATSVVTPSVPQPQEVTAPVTTVPETIAPAPKTQPIEPEIILPVPSAITSATANKSEVTPTVTAPMPSSEVTVPVTMTSTEPEIILPTPTVTPVTSSEVTLPVTPVPSEVTPEEVPAVPQTLSERAKKTYATAKEKLSNLLQENAPSKMEQEWSRQHSAEESIRRKAEERRLDKEIEKMETTYIEDQEAGALLENSLAEQRKLQAADESEQARLIQEAQELAPQLARQRKLEAFADRAEGAKLLENQLEEQKELELAADIKGIKLLEEQLEQQKELERAADTAAAEQWKASPQAYAELLNEKDALNNEIEQARQQEKNDKNKLIKLTEERLNLEKTGTLESVVSWATGKRTVGSINKDIEALNNKVKEDEASQRSKKEQLAQVQKEITATPYLTRGKGTLERRNAARVKRNAEQAREAKPATKVKTPLLR